MIERIWKDPVWSKVIAATIIAVVALLTHIFMPDWKQRAEEFFLAQTVLPKWAIFIASIVFLMVVVTSFFLIRKKQKKSNSPENLSSEVWFDEIEEQISDCSMARIYLRSFAHPDQFRIEHREVLLRFMQSLARRLESGADIEIVAYHYPEDMKSGLDWLKSELSNENIASERITLISKQPVSNSSSMYLFDSGVMLYNRRNSKHFSYYIEDLSGTVVHHMLEKGFGAARSEVK